jgi:hypothetical protein
MWRALAMIAVQVEAFPTSLIRLCVSSSAI